MQELMKWIIIEIILGYRIAITTTNLQKKKL